MKNLSYLNLKPEQFKRRFGVQIQTFKQMVNALKQYSLENPKDKRGRHCVLTIEEQVLVALEYWREYRTYDLSAQIGESLNQLFAELSLILNLL